MTVGSEGEFEIPVAICESMGIVDGTQIRLQQDGARIIVEVGTEAASESGLNE